MTLTFLPSSIVCYAFESCLHCIQSSELFKDNTNCTKRVSLEAIFGAERELRAVVVRSE